MSPMRDGRTNDDERTREDRATQPMDAGWLSFAIAFLKFAVFAFHNTCSFLLCQICRLLSNIWWKAGNKRDFIYARKEL